MKYRRKTSIVCTLGALALANHAYAIAIITNAVDFQNATATFSQANFGANEAIDNSLSLGGNGWATLGRSETLVWETTQNVGDGGMDSYNFRIYQDTNNSFTQFLRNFRLSYTTADRSTFADGLINGGDVTTSWTVISNFTNLSSDKPFTLSNASGNISTTKSVSTIDANTTTTGYYDLSANIAANGITGFRLEALNTPGWHTGDNNFVLREMQLTTTAPVPEPSSMVLGALGSGVLLLRRRRKS